MNRHEQIGLDAARLLHAHLQRNEEIGVAREHRTHVRFGVDLGLEPLGNGQGDVLFIAAAAPDGTGILAAMPRIEHDRHQAVDHRLAAAGPFDARLALRHTRSLGRGCGLPGALCLGIDLPDQLRQRVRRLERVDVEHQTMAVFTHRRQDEDLRLHLLLELHHQAHDPGLEAPGAQQLDVRVVRRNLGRQALEDAVELDALHVHHQAFGVLDREVGVFERQARFDRHPGVIGSRPDAYGEHADARRKRPSDGADEQDERRAGGADQLATTQKRPACWARKAFRHCAPAALRASSSTTRPCSGAASAKRKTTARSAWGTWPAALSGHSTKQIESLRKYSPSPASSNSSGSLNR